MPKQYPTGAKRGELGATMVEWVLVITLLGGMFTTVTAVFLRQARRGIAVALIHTTMTDALSNWAPTLVRLSALEDYSTMDAPAGFDLQSAQAEDFFEDQAEHFIERLRADLENKLTYLAPSTAGLGLCLRIVSATGTDTYFTQSEGVSNCNSINVAGWTQAALDERWLPFQDIFSPTPLYAQPNLFVVLIATWSGVLNTPLITSADLLSGGNVPLGDDAADD